MPLARYLDGPLNPKSGLPEAKQTSVYLRRQPSSRQQ